MRWTAVYQGRISSSAYVSIYARRTDGRSTTGPRMGAEHGFVPLHGFLLPVCSERRLTSSEIAAERTDNSAPGTFASLLEFSDTRGGEPLLPAPMFPLDVDVLVDDPREFGSGIPFCANVTAMSCSAGVMGGSFDTGEVDQVPRLGDFVLNDSTESWIVNGGGGIQFWGNVLAAGSEVSLNPTLSIDS